MNRNPFCRTDSGIELISGADTVRRYRSGGLLADR